MIRFVCSVMQKPRLIFVQAVVGARSMIRKNVIIKAKGIRIPPLPPLVQRTDFPKIGLHTQECS